jgi:hypothetical protein
MLAKQSKEDSKNNHHPKPNPVTPPPPLIHPCPIDRVKLTRESVIPPMLGHKEMGGECPSIGEIGVKVAPWPLVNGKITKIETILASLMP